MSDMAGLKQARQEASDDRPKDAPDSPGYWAFEGYIDYANPPIPNPILREVVRVYWGSTTDRLYVERVRGIHPAYMLIGKWTRLHLPWEAKEQA